MALPVLVLIWSDIPAGLVLEEQSMLIHTAGQEDRLIGSHESLLLQIP